MMVRNISSLCHCLIACLTHNAARCKNGYGGYTTSRRRQRSSETFVISNRIHATHNLNILTGNQLRQDLRRWLSSPDPSTNHNIARNAHYDGTANWSFRGAFYKEWRSTGSDSLLWIHGKRASLFYPLPDTV